MARLRYNALHAELAADIDTVETAVTFAESLKEYGTTAIPNIVSPDILPLYRAGEVVYLTDYDNSALTGTISRGEEDSTAVAHTAADTATSPFKHGATKEDLASVGDSTPDVHYTKPTHNTTRSSSTLGSFGTPWTDSVTVDDGEDVEYAIDVSYQTVGFATAYFALAVDGTIVDSAVNGHANGSTSQARERIGGVVTGLSTGAHTFEVFGATHGAEQLTITSTPATGTGVSLTRDGVSSMRLRVVNAV